MAKSTWYIYQIILMTWSLFMLCMFLYIIYHRRKLGIHFKNLSKNTVFLNWLVGTICCIISVVRCVDPYGVLDIYPTGVGVACASYIASFLYLMMSRSAYLCISLSSTTKRMKRGRKAQLSIWFLNGFHIFSVFSTALMFFWSTLNWFLHATELSNDAFWTRDSYVLLYGPLLFINACIAVWYFFKLRKLMEGPSSLNTSSSATRTRSASSPRTIRKHTSADKMHTASFLLQKQVVGIFVLVGLFVTPACLIRGINGLKSEDTFDDTLPDTDNESFHMSISTDFLELIAVAFILSYVHGHHLSSKKDVDKKLQQIAEKDGDSSQSVPMDSSNISSAT